MPDLYLCVAVRNGRRPTVYSTMDEAIFALYGWPDAEYKKCVSAEEALTYLRKSPLEYPRWFRLLVCPETRDDFTEPSITEASPEEFRKTFFDMRAKGFPEIRFPAWFMEKIAQEDRDRADREKQAPSYGQSNSLHNFGPNDLSRRTWRNPPAEEQAARAVRALQARKQAFLSTQEQQAQKRMLHIIRSAANPLPPMAAVESSTTPQHHELMPDVNHQENSGYSIVPITSAQEASLAARVSRWVESSRNEEHPDEFEDMNEHETSSYDDDVEFEIETLLWTFSSATLYLTPTSAMILGSPGSPSADWAQRFIPATDQVDLWGITEEEAQMTHVNKCLGPAANRYFQLHYYSQASKAVFVRAYCLHHKCFADFLQHLFRRGVLPRMATYIWEVLGRSFNWASAMETGIGGRNLVASGSLGRCADPVGVDFGACPECKEAKVIVKLNRGSAGDM